MPEEINDTSEAERSAALARRARLGDYDDGGAMFDLRHDFAEGRLSSKMLLF